MLLSGPTTHVRADLREQFEGRVRGDAIDLREIDAAGELMEWSADLEAGFVVAWLLGDARRRQGRGGGGCLCACASMARSQAPS